MSNWQIEETKAHLGAYPAAGNKQMCLRIAELRNIN
jgi:hypothetical protein